MEVRLSLNNNFDGLSARNLSTRKKLPNSSTHPVSDAMESSAGRHAAENILEKKSDYKNNINRPTESVSFGGSAVSGENTEKNKNKKKNIIMAAAFGTVAIGAAALLAASKIKKGNGDIFTKIASSKKFHNMLDFAEENEAQIKAALALGLAGILKPICVLAMPGAEREDKQFTATKNCISAILGYVLSCAILNPISSGVNRFMNNPAEFLGADNALVKRFAEEKKELFKPQTFKERWFSKYKMNESGAFKTTYKNALGIFVAPAKAALTIALMPLVLKFLFGDTKKKKDETNKVPLYMEPLYNPILNDVSKNNSPFNMFAKKGETK